jgi:hypothetical protein
MKANKNEWNVSVVSNLSLECECKKEFQVFATSLKNAVVEAEKIIKKDGNQWKIRSVWWIQTEPNRGKEK